MSMADRSSVAMPARAAARLFHDEAAVAMNRRSFMTRAVTTEAKLPADRHPGVHLDDAADLHISRCSRSRTKDEAFGGRLWPDHPTLRNFEIVFRRAASLPRITSGCSCGIRCSSRSRRACSRSSSPLARRSRSAASRCAAAAPVMNLALFTYFIPAAFLAVPMYKAMGVYGLLNNQWALILAMIDDCGAVFDLGAEAGIGQAAVTSSTRRRRSMAPRRCSCFRLVYLPLMMPSLVADRHLRAAARVERVPVRVPAPVPRHATSRSAWRSATSSPQTTRHGNC